MSLSKLLPAIQTLPRADKWRLMQLMMIELSQEEGAPLLTAGAEYPVWSPLKAHDAAETLLQMLEVRKAAT